MGKRGPIGYKGRTQDANTAGEPNGPPAIGAPPEHLRDEAKAVWRSIVEVLPDSVLAAADALLLEILADATVDYREAQETVRTEGATIATKSGRHRHPAAVAAQQHRQAMRACFGDLGMSPQARARLGMAMEREEADDLDDLIGG